jgi:hypothetical protein
VETVCGLIFWQLVDHFRHFFRQKKIGDNSQQKSIYVHLKVQEISIINYKILKETIICVSEKKGMGIF